MVSRKLEAVIPPELVRDLLQASGDEILIGGQALADWVRAYQVAVPEQIGAISNDVDFLAASAGNRDRVAAYARILDGKDILSQRARVDCVGRSRLSRLERDRDSQRRCAVERVWHRSSSRARPGRAGGVEVTLSLSCTFRCCKPPAQPLQAARGSKTTRGSCNCAWRSTSPASSSARSSGRHAARRRACLGEALSGIHLGHRAPRGRRCGSKVAKRYRPRRRRHRPIAHSPGALLGQALARASRRMSASYAAGILPPPP